MVDFESVYLEYYLTVYRFAYSLCRNEHLAEEISQETFLKAFNSFSEFRGDCTVRTWLCQIAKNLCYSYWRKQKKEQRTISAEQAQDDFSARFYDRETSAQLHALIHQLKEPYKEVFLLRVFGELSFSEISRLFQKTESWARVTYHRAKTTLLDQLKGENP
ncbi:RNA polymerase sigma factor [Massiliimalia massiliensis]|uniref:RNA polymerase sigma factor n=1 Tax=Massiliimalia massiliensis TaxID=1852384 RepID=UPI0009871EA3|nr:RNA polymerase sigma factor [Massiliimalia massiliensis]